MLMPHCDEELVTGNNACSVKFCIILDLRIIMETEKELCSLILIFALKRER